jgi:pimeloyl-ACP methyl ester carboxylesterase
MFMPVLRLPGVLDIQTTRYASLAATDTGSSSGTSTGGRPPLVFLHGLGFSRRHWTPVIAELADRRAVSFDLPGHGGSPARDSYDVGELAAVLHDAVQAAELTPPVVVGHSYGGVLATAYAARYRARGVVNVDQPLLPGGFARLLCEAEAVLRGPDYGIVWQSLVDGMHTELLPPQARDLVRAAPIPARNLLLGYWRELLVMSERELADRQAKDLAVIRASGIPYRYVAGSEPPAAYADWLRSMLPGVSITVLPQTGHFPHLARPAELARLLAG